MSKSKSSAKASPALLKTQKALVQEALAHLKTSKVLKAQRASRLALWTDSKDSKCDVSALDAAIAATESSLKGARSALASAFGSKPVEFVLPISFAMQTTGGAGILSAPLAVDVSTSTEWSSLAALFDEFRVLRGKMDFMVMAPAGALTTSGATTFSPNSMLVLAWDPADATALTSTRGGCEIQQHQLYASSMRYAGAAGSYSGVYEGKHSFHFQVAKYAELIMGGAPSTNASPGYWKQTVAPGTDGWVKPYLQTLMGTLNDNSVGGILYLTVQLRCRT